jgi:hypothetical protein
MRNNNCFAIGLPPTCRNNNWCCFSHAKRSPTGPLLHPTKLAMDSSDRHGRSLTRDDREHRRTSQAHEGTKHGAGREQFRSMKDFDKQEQTMRSRFDRTTGHSFPPSPRAWLVALGAADMPIGCALNFIREFNSLHTHNTLWVLARVCALMPVDAPRSADYVPAAIARRLPARP